MEIMRKKCKPEKEKKTITLEKKNAFTQRERKPKIQQTRKIKEEKKSTQRGSKKTKFS